MTAEPRRRSTAEWVSLSVSIVLLGAVVVALVLQIGRGGEPALPVVTVAEVIARDDGSFHVTVDVRNDGDRAAAEVQVSASLTAPDGSTTEGDQTIDFLGAGESETLRFVFADDPERGELEIAVSGFAVP